MNGFKGIKQLIIEGEQEQSGSASSIEVLKVYLKAIEGMTPLLDFNLLENDEIALRQIINLTGKPLYEQKVFYPLTNVNKDFNRYMFSMKIGVTQYSDASFLFFFVTPIGIGYSIFSEPTVHLKNFTWIIDKVKISEKEREADLLEASKREADTGIAQSSVFTKFEQFESEEVQNVFNSFNFDKGFIKELRTVVNLNETQFQSRFAKIKEYLDGGEKGKGQVILEKNKLMEVIYYD